MHVNLIDTPGHPDFIAEVERVLSVLDGAVLVISAVEGVQPQTRILMRALQRLRIPTLLFVNKIDRPGRRRAGAASVVRAPDDAIVRWGPCTSSARAPPPSRADDTALRRWPRCSRNATTGSWRRTSRTRPTCRPTCSQTSLAAQTARALVHPVFFGSAVTGDGLESLLAGITELLPAAAGDPDGPVSGAVFKIERGASGEKIAYVRMFSGTIRVRDRLQFGRGLDDKVTAIAVFEHGPAVQRPVGLGRSESQSSGVSPTIQIGDRIGELANRRRGTPLRPADAGVGRRRASGPTTARDSASRSRSSPSRTR